MTYKIEKSDKRALVMKSIDLKKLMPNLPYLLFVYLFDQGLGQAARLCAGLASSNEAAPLVTSFAAAFPHSSVRTRRFTCGRFGRGTDPAMMAVSIKAKISKKYRRGAGTTAHEMGQRRRSRRTSCRC